MVTSIHTSISVTKYFPFVSCIYFISYMNLPFHKTVFMCKLHIHMCTHTQIFKEFKIILEG